MNEPQPTTPAWDSMKKASLEEQPKGEPPNAFIRASYMKDGKRVNEAYEMSSCLVCEIMKGIREQGWKRMVSSTEEGKI